jgi:hypothetical protein
VSHLGKERGVYRLGAVLFIAGLAVNIVAVALDNGLPQLLLFVVGTAMLLASVFLLLARGRERWARGG